jgi:hypothetical protein
VLRDEERGVHKITFSGRTVRKAVLKGERIKDAGGPAFICMGVEEGPSVRW